MNALAFHEVGDDLKDNPLLSRSVIPLEIGVEVQAGGCSHEAHYLERVVASPFVITAANLLYNSWVSDMMTGQKAMSTELFRSLELRETGFAIEAEITARLLRRGIRIYEVPIGYTARSREDGKELTALDGLRVLRTLIRCRVS